MAEGDAPSSSLARLRERVEGTVKINLSKTSRSRRIASLQELRRSVAEAKRAEYFKRLNSAFCEERGAPGEAASLEAEQEEPRVCNEEEEESLEPDAPTNAVLGRFDALCPRKPPGRSRESFRDIAGVLVNHEFLVATHMGIREEAAALKRSLLFVRPDGRRVLVVVNNFWATAYCRLGTKRHSFRVPFTKGPTVLDCVVKDYGNMGDRGEEELQYFVLDVLLYNGCLLAPSDTECRTFFLKSRLEEAAAETCRPSFVMVEYQECTPEAMRDAYYRAGDLPYERDSIIFVDRTASYVGGYNPNWLCWRDENTSMYVKVSSNGMAPARVVYDHADRVFRTLDDVVVGTVPHWFHATRDRIATVMIKRVDVCKMQVEEIVIPGRQCHFDRHHARHTHLADTLRKIVRRFILDNQLDLDSEGSYNRLVDAVASV